MQKEKRYNDFSSFIRRKFNTRVQKVSIDAGFTCPNKDGTKGVGGCTYCNNNTFNPDYCKPIKPIKQQINEGIEFFSKKYKTQKYLAYFQAFTNTYAPLADLKKMYEEALDHEDVIGLVVATRPDCIKNEVLDYLEELAAAGNFIKLEFGLESTKNETLEAINRCQTHEEAIDAFKRADGRGEGKSLGYSTYFGGGFAGSSATFGPLTTEWKKYEYTWTSSNTFTFYSYWWPNSTTDPYAIDMCDFQVEINKGHSTNFVEGTRSNTESIVDLTGQRQLDTSNIEWSDLQHPHFHGASHYIDMSDNPQNGEQFASWEFVTKFDVIYPPDAHIFLSMVKLFW